MIKNIFLDLDGTMLPMDMKKFMKLYFSSGSMPLYRNES